MPILTIAFIASLITLIYINSYLGVVNDYVLVRQIITLNQGKNTNQLQFHCNFKANEIIQHETVKLKKKTVSFFGSSKNVMMDREIKTTSTHHRGNHTSIKVGVCERAPSP